MDQIAMSRAFLVNVGRATWSGLPLRALVLLVWLSASLFSGLLHAASFSATLDRDTVTVGESATLTLTFDGGDPASTPTLPPMPNLRAEASGSSRNMSIINGQVSSTLSQSYLITPLREGEYAIPSLQANIGGQTYASPALKLRAVKPAAAAADQSGQQLAFMRLVVPKKEVFLGEVLAVELQVYVRDGVANAENILRSFDAFGATPVNAEGFSVLKTAHTQRRRSRLGNAGYTIATLVTSLTPLKTGQLSIGSIDANLTLQLPLPGQRRGDSFDPFGFFQRYQEQRVVLSAEPVTLNVVALPAQNVPSDFNGAVGTYSLAMTAGPTNVAAGDPVTVKIQISGRGALDSLTLPEQPAWKDFKAYPPTTHVETTDPLGLQGTKIFEQVVIPQNSAVHAIPGVSLSFFDPDQKAYRTLKESAIPLVVRPVGASPAPSYAAISRPGQDSPPPAQDIVPIKQRFGTLARPGAALLQTPWFLCFQILPLAGFAGALFWRKRKEHLSRNPRLLRQRRVANMVREGIVELRQLAEQQQTEPFFANLFRLLQEQVGERLDLPASAITEAVLEEHLRPRGVRDSTLLALHDLFQACNLARYAPTHTSRELAGLVPKLETALRELREANL